MATDRAEAGSAVRIAVMAKAPIAGLAKTRLIPTLGAAAAARLQRRLTRQTVATAVDAAVGPVTVWAAPDVTHVFLRALQRCSAIELRAQAAGDLGARMHAAFCAARVPLLVIGTDCPVLRPAHLRRAAQALRDGSDAVFHPAEDGGYVLVGLRCPQPFLFESMPWSTAAVMDETRARLRRLALRTTEFETLWDVDEATDYARLLALDPQPADAA